MCFSFFFLVECVFCSLWVFCYVRLYQRLLFAWFCLSDLCFIHLISRPSFVFSRRNSHVVFCIFCTLHLFFGTFQFSFWTVFFFRYWFVYCLKFTFLCQWKENFFLVLELLLESDHTCLHLFDLNVQTGHPSFVTFKSWTVAVLVYVYHIWNLLWAFYLSHRIAGLLRQLRCKQALFLNVRNALGNAHCFPLNFLFLICPASLCLSLSLSPLFALFHCLGSSHVPTPSEFSLFFFLFLFIVLWFLFVLFAFTYSLFHCLSLCSLCMYIYIYIYIYTCMHFHCRSSLVCSLCSLPPFCLRILSVIYALSVFSLCLRFFSLSLSFFGDTQTDTVDDSRDFLILVGHFMVTRLPLVLSVTCHSILWPSTLSQVKTTVRVSPIMVAESE